MIKLFRRLKLLKSGKGSIAVLLGLEFVAIVMAIVLGFMVNDWRETKQRDRVLESAMFSLAKEMRFNHQQLAVIWEYYDWILDRIRDARTEEHNEDASDISYGYHLDGWRGAMPTLIRSSTFNMLLSTGIIGDMPFETADRLALIYKAQEILEMLDAAVLQEVASNPEYTHINNIAYKFNLYNEIIPSVLGLYLKIGSEILGPYGYEAEVNNEGLLAEIEMQMAHFQY